MRLDSLHFYGEKTPVDWGKRVETIHASCGHVGMDHNPGALLKTQLWIYVTLPTKKGKIKLEI